VRGYPVFLDLAGRTCLVVGGGRVGLGKARGLIDAGATVLVVDPAPSDKLLDLERASALVTIAARRFEARDLDGVLLAFACTGEASVNASVVEAAAARGVLVCDAGTGRLPGGGSPATEFASAAIVRRGDLCVAVSSGGTAPALAAYVRDRIASQLGDEAGEAATLLGELRERLIETVEDGGTRRRAIRQVLDSGFVEMLAAGRRVEAAALCDAAVAGARTPSAAQDHRTNAKEDTCTR